MVFELQYLELNKASKNILFACQRPFADDFSHKSLATPVFSKCIKMETSHAFEVSTRNSCGTLVQSQCYPLGYHLDLQAPALIRIREFS